MDEGRMLFYVVVFICLAGGFALLLRIAMERKRLVSRYNHIKKLLEYREAMRIKIERKNQEVAQEAAANEAPLSPPPSQPAADEDEEVFTVQPVGES